MNSKLIIFALTSLLFSGCYEAGYHPSYIISHTPVCEEEAPQEPVEEEQQR